MIYIIGAGPIGCYAAYSLSSKYNVKVFEQKNEVGEPVQCTGIFTSEILKYIPTNSEFIINRPNAAKIIAPNGKSIIVKSKKKDIVVNRKQFDQFFFEKATKRRKVRINLNHELIKISERSLVFQRKDNGKKVSYPLKKGDIVIGADGPNSKIYKFMNKKNKKMIHGFQYLLKKDNDNQIEFYPNKKITSWIVPENTEQVRIGSMGKINETHHQNFIKKVIPNFNNKIISKQHGLIPIFDNKIKFFKHIKNKRRDLKLFLVGDAGNFVKATTHGGIITGFESVRILKKAIIENKNYNFLIKTKLAPKLTAHLLAHKIFNNMSSKNWNKLIKEFKSKKIIKILEQNHRDLGNKLYLKILLAKPSFIKYAKYLKK